MEARQKKKRRSSILKNRKSLADVDSNAFDVTMTEEDRKGLKRRVSFANTYQVKEITRVADIAEKWPDPTLHVDTTNISDASRLSCAVPTKKPSSDMDVSSLSSLLLAPLASNQCPTTSSDAFNDSNMELTTICSTAFQRASHDKQQSTGKQVPFNGEAMLPLKQTPLEPMFMIKEETSEDEPGFPLYNMNEDEEDTAVVDSLKNVPVPSFLLSSSKSSTVDRMEKAPLASPSGVSVEIICENNAYNTLHSSVILTDAIPNKSLPPLAARNYSARPPTSIRPDSTADSDNPMDGNDGDNTVFLNETVEMTVHVPDQVSVSSGYDAPIPEPSPPLSMPSWIIKNKVSALQMTEANSDVTNESIAPDLNQQDMEVTCKLTSVIQHHVTSPFLTPQKKAVLPSSESVLSPIRTMQSDERNELEFTCIVSNNQGPGGGSGNMSETNDHTNMGLNDSVELTCMPKVFDKEVSTEGMEFTMVQPVPEANSPSGGGKINEFLTLYPKDYAEPSMVETSPENRVVATSALYVTTPKGHHSENMLIKNDVMDQANGGNAQGVSSDFTKLSKARNSISLYTRHIIHSSQSLRTDEEFDRLGLSDTITQSPKSPQYPHSPLENDVTSIQSPEKYTDRMLSSSMVAEDEINDLVSPEQVLGEECFSDEQDCTPRAMLEGKSDDNMFKFSPLENCEEEKCDLFEGSPVLDPSRGGKRHSEEMEASPETQEEKEVSAEKKICLDVPDHVESLDDSSSKAGLAEKTDLQNKEDRITELPSTQDALLMLTSMTEIQKVLPDSIGIQDFLQNYTDVRLGSYIKTMKRGQSLVPHKKPENIGERAEAVFVYARSNPICNKFLQSVQQKMESLSEEVEGLEQQIHANNTEVMRRIRFGSEEESEHLRAEVESLASRCRQVAKAEWKRDKGKLNKALAKLKEDTYKNDLEPIGNCLNQFGKIEELMQAAVEDLERANAVAVEQLQALPDDPPTDEQIDCYKEQSEEISNLSKNLKYAEESRAKATGRRAEMKSKLEHLWSMVEEKECSEREQEERRKKAAEDLELQKQHCFWKLVKDDERSTDFSFLNNSLIVRAIYAKTDKQEVDCYNVDDNLQHAKLTRRQKMNSKFVIGLLQRNLTSTVLLEKGPNKDSIHRAINFASIHVSKARRLLKQISSVQSFYSNVGIFLKEKSVVADFDGDSPNLCSFQVRFDFVRDDDSTAFKPVCYTFLESETSFGKYDKSAIEKALGEVSPTSIFYFRDLADAVLNLIRNKR